MRKTLICGIAALGLVSLSCSPKPAQSEPAQTTVQIPAKPATQPVAWQSLFDGKTLGHWKQTNFGTKGDVKIENGQLILEKGELLTGVTWQGAVPAKMNYEIELDAMRVDGHDFFVGLTFPFNDTFASLILGGWGGGICGISSIDDEDAAHNETGKDATFENGKWYHIRLKITPDHMRAWIDDMSIVDYVTKDRRISVRVEVEPSEPLGLASYQTTAAIKNIRFRKIAS